MVAIISLLAALLLPALRRAKEGAYRAVCVNNLRQIGFAIASYSNDYDGFGPVVPLVGGVWQGAEDYWMVQLAPYLKGPPASSMDGFNFNAANRPSRLMKIFQCPSTWNKFAVWGPSSYAVNTYVLTEEDPNNVYLNLKWPLRLSDPSVAGKTQELVLVAESVGGGQIIPHWGVRLYDYLHLRQRNYLLADGHVESMPDPIYFSAPRKLFAIQEDPNREWWGYNWNQGTPAPLAPGITYVPP